MKIPTNVAYGLLTVLNIKTNASKCSIAGFFLTKGITQHFPRYIHCRTTADSAGGSSRCMRDFVRFMFAVESPAQCIWVNAVRLCSTFPAFIEAILEAGDC